MNALIRNMIECIQNYRIVFSVFLALANRQKCENRDDHKKRLKNGSNKSGQKMICFFWVDFCL